MQASMTSLQLLTPSQESLYSPVHHKSRRPLKTQWHYGPAYVVIAAIAPFLLISLLLVHLHTLGTEWLNLLTGWLNTER